MLRPYLKFYVKLPSIINLSVLFSTNTCMLVYAWWGSQILDENNSWFYDRGALKLDEFFHLLIT